MIRMDRLIIITHDSIADTDIHDVNAQDQFVFEHAQVGHPTRQL